MKDINSWDGIKVGDTAVYHDPRYDEDILNQDEAVQIRNIVDDDGQVVFFFMKGGDIHRRLARRFRKYTPPTSFMETGGIDP